MGSHFFNFKNLSVNTLTMKTVILASLLAGAAAFAPASKQAASTQLAGAGGKAAFGNEIGAQIPVSLVSLQSSIVDMLSCLVRSSSV